MMWLTFIHNRLLLSHRKNEIMSSTATLMDLETIIVSEVSQRQISLTCKSLKNDINELIYKTEVDSHRKRTCGSGEG